MRQPRRIVFTGDIFRVAPERVRPTQSQNILWLFRLLRQQIRIATRLEPEVVVWPTDITHETALSPTTIPTFYAMMGLQPSMDGWAALHDRATLPDIVEGWLGALFDDALVIGFEIPPVLRRFFDRSGIEWIDLVIHPVRFLDDIFFALATSSAAMRLTAESFLLSADFLFTMAGLQSAAAGRGYTPPVPPDSALVLFQVRDDKTQISEGRFVGMQHFMPELALLNGAHRALLLKPHPMDADNPGYLATDMAFPEAKSVSDNFYKLLSTDHIRTVVSLSSSTSVEASYFGKRSTFLLRSPYRMVSLGDTGPDAYMDLDWSLLSADFWRVMLGNHMPCTPLDGVGVPFKPNRLRIALSAFWNFNQIDTDIAVAAHRG